MQETAQMRASLLLKHEQLNEVRDFEENEARNNRELEGRIRSLGQQVSRQRSLLKSQQQLKTALHNEVTPKAKFFLCNF
jgi:capsule polysaccharide export protein KpsE/RkpR